MVKIERKILGEVVLELVDEVEELHAGADLAYRCEYKTHRQQGSDEDEHDLMPLNQHIHEFCNVCTKNYS